MRKVSHVFVPFTAYLLTGLILIKVAKYSELLDDGMYFVVWGIVTAAIVGIKECFDNKAVTIGIGVYIALIVLWFGLIADDSYQIHAVLAVTGLLGMQLFNRLYRCRAVRVLSGYLMMFILLCLELMDCSFSSSVIALAVFLFLYSVSETIALSERYNTDTFLFLYGVIAVITVFTPAPREPYDWNFVVKAVQAAENMAEHVMVEVQYWWGPDKSDGMFGYSYTGYSDSSSLLTAGLRNRKTEQLTLDGKRTKRNLYLKGKNSDVFTGKCWEASLEMPTMDYRIDTLETLYALFAHTQDIEELHRFAEVYEHRVTLSYIRTQSQFYPLKILGTTVSDVQYVGDNLVSGQVQGKGYSYAYQFVDIDYASAEIAEIIENSKNITYEKEAYDLIYTKMQEYYGIKLETVSFADFLEQVESGKERIKSAYGIADGAVSEQVRALARELTKDCSNDYEKCRALEQYLYQYAYRQDIVVPEDANVLDWFLFDGRQGFCVHYATALAEMLRCVGIPARVAEGFLIDYSDSTTVNQFSISGSSAHAWTEAYIEGFGWMRLEPTVVNASNANMAWYNAVPEREAQEDTALEEVCEGEVPEKEESEKTELEEEDSGITGTRRETDFWVMLAALSGGLAVMILLILLALWLYRRHVLRKSNDPNVIFRHLLSLLEKKYMPKENNETVREYFARLSETEQITEEAKANLAVLAERMERYWYSEIPLRDNDIQIIKNIRNDFL